MPVLLVALSDGADEVVQRSLEVIAHIVSLEEKTKTEKLHDFINSLIKLFHDDRRLLDERGCIIIR